MRTQRESFTERQSLDMWPAWQVLAIVFLIAVGLNYPWELAQGRLFTAASHTTNVWVHCFIASLGDGLMILLLFGFGWLVLGRRDWFARPGVRGYAIIVAAGAALAIAIEWTAVHVLQRWTYTESMPHVPGLEIGLVPVLQMMVLPPIVLRIAASIENRRRHALAI